MKRMAIIALCLLSSFASAKDIEEVVVKATRIRIVIDHISKSHKQDPITGNWYYVEAKAPRQRKMELEVASAK
jgi:hypothetical protein